jgi:integrase
MSRLSAPSPAAMTLHDEPGAIQTARSARTHLRSTGAGSDRPKEQPPASRPRSSPWSTRSPRRYRAAVLLTAWRGWRRGEVLRLCRADVDLAAGAVTVRRSRVEMLSSGAAHMEKWAGADRVFVGRDGRPMRGDAAHATARRAAPKYGGFEQVNRSPGRWPLRCAAWFKWREDVSIGMGWAPLDVLRAPSERCCATAAQP